MDEQQNIIIYRTADGKASVALYARDGKIWLNQQQMAELFATSKPNISMHIANILKEKELTEVSVVKNFLTTAADGKNYNVVFYSLEMIIAVGYRVRGVRGTQFRQWATEHLTEYLVKGFTMDDERLKNPDGRPDYFDELLLRIRDIRASEKRFYQKIRDLFALSSDYDKSDKATQMFFAETQNKLLYAVTHQTAAELMLTGGQSPCAHTNKSPIFFDFFRSRYSVSVLQFSKGFSHTLKILLYLYINIELIFDLHTIDFGTVTL